MPLTVGAAGIPENNGIYNIPQKNNKSVTINKVIYNTSYFQNIMYDKFKNISNFALLFDETLNMTNQKKQLDLHIRYWHIENNKVATRYLMFVFTGHATAANILESFQATVKKIKPKITPNKYGWPSSQLEFL